MILLVNHQSVKGLKTNELFWRSTVKKWRQWLILRWRHGFLLVSVFSAQSADLHLSPFPSKKKNILEEPSLKKQLQETFYRAASGKKLLPVCLCLRLWRQVKAICISTYICTSRLIFIFLLISLDVFWQKATNGWYLPKSSQESTNLISQVADQRPLPLALPLQPFLNPGFGKCSTFATFDTLSTSLKSLESLCQLFLKGPLHSLCLPRRACHQQRWVAKFKYRWKWMSVSFST